MLLINKLKLTDNIYFITIECCVTRAVQLRTLTTYVISISIYMYVAHCISIRSSIETFLKLIDVHTLSFSRQAGGAEVFEGNEYIQKKKDDTTHKDRCLHMLLWIQPIKKVLPYLQIVGKKKKHLNNLSREEEEREKKTANGFSFFSHSYLDDRLFLISFFFFATC